MNHTIEIMGQWVSLSKILQLYLVGLFYWRWNREKTAELPQIISVISWQSALLVEEFKQNHRIAVRHFSYIVVIMFITGGIWSIKRKPQISVDLDHINKH